jgi:hypothetical protein
LRRGNGLEFALPDELSDGEKFLAQGGVGIDRLGVGHFRTAVLVNDADHAENIEDFEILGVMVKFVFEEIARSIGKTTDEFGELLLRHLRELSLGDAFVLGRHGFGLNPFPREMSEVGAATRPPLKFSTPFGKGVLRAAHLLGDLFDAPLSLAGFDVAKESFMCGGRFLGQRIQGRRGAG